MQSASPLPPGRFQSLLVVFRSETSALSVPFWSSFEGVALLSSGGSASMSAGADALPIATFWSCGWPLLQPPAAASEITSTVFNVLTAARMGYSPEANCYGSVTRYGTAVSLPSPERRDVERCLVAGAVDEAVRPALRHDLVLGPEAQALLAILADVAEA